MKHGRRVKSVRISWTPKKPALQQTLNLKVLEHDSFPESGAIRGTPWEPLVHEGAPGRDPDFVGTRFASWCIRSKIPLRGPSVKARFKTFCGGMDQPRKPAAKQPDPSRNTSDIEEISAYSEFPQGMITHTVFGDIASQYAPDSDPEAIADRYRQHIRTTGNPAGIPSTRRHDTPERLHRVLPSLGQLEAADHAAIGAHMHLYSHTHGRIYTWAYVLT